MHQHPLNFHLVDLIPLILIISKFNTGSKGNTYQKRKQTIANWSFRGLASGVLNAKCAKC